MNGLEPSIPVTNLEFFLYLIQDKMTELLVTVQPVLKICGVKGSAGRLVEHLLSA